MGSVTALLPFLLATRCACSPFIRDWARKPGWVEELVKPTHLIAVVLRALEIASARVPTLTDTQKEAPWAWRECANVREGIVCVCVGYRIVEYKPSERAHGRAYSLGDKPTSEVTANYVTAISPKAYRKKQNTQNNVEVLVQSRPEARG